MVVSQCSFFLSNVDKHTALIWYSQLWKSLVYQRNIPTDLCTYWIFQRSVAVHKEKNNKKLFQTHDYIFVLPNACIFACLIGLVIFIHLMIILSFACSHKHSNVKRYNCICLSWVLHELVFFLSFSCNKRKRQRSIYIIYMMAAATMFCCIFCQVQRFIHSL